MIKYIRHDGIDKVEWDKTIKASPNGMVYAMSWYLDVVHPGWDALVEDGYASVMPLTGNRKHCISYLFQPFFAQQLGLFSRDAVTQDKLNRFLKAVPRRYRLTEIRLNEACMFDDVHLKPHRNIILPLENEIATMKNKYHTNTKRNLAVAEKCNLRVVENVDVEDIVRLFRENRGSKVEHWGDAEYERFGRLCKAAKIHRCLVSRGVTDEKSNLLAGMVLFNSNGRLTFIFSGRDEKSAAKQGMTFLIHSILEEFCGQPLVFDFEGSDDDNLARFELGFGGKEVYYPEYRIDNLNFLERKIKSIFAHGK